MTTDQKEAMIAAGKQTAAVLGAIAAMIGMFVMVIFIPPLVTIAVALVGLVGAFWYGFYLQEIQDRRGKE